MTHEAFVVGSFTLCTGRSLAARLSLREAAAVVTQPSRSRGGLQVLGDISTEFQAMVHQHPHSPSLHPRCSPLSTTWNIITGGLNTQSLHHVLPSVHHCHYPTIYPLFLSVCKRHGVHPKSARNAAVFVRGYLKWIESLSKDGNGHD